MQFRQTKAQRERADRERQYESRTVASRVARPLAFRQGFLLGKTTSELTQGKSVGVIILVRSGTDAAGKGIWIDTGKTKTAWDFFLNSSDTIPSGTKVKIQWYKTCWVITQAYCEADDSATAGAAATQQATYSQSASGNPNVGPMVLRRRR